MSIKKRIILLVMIPVFLCLSAAGGVSIFFMRKLSLENMQRQSEITSTAYSQTLTQAMGKYTAQVEALARDAAFFDPQTTDTQKLALLQRYAKTSDVTNIGIFGEDGKSIFIGYEDGTLVPTGAADISGRAYLARALGGETVMNGPAVDVVTKKLTVTIATKAVAPESGRCIVAVDFNLQFVNDVLERAVYGKSGFTLLLDRNGLIIYDPAAALVGRTYQEAMGDEGDLAAAIDLALASQQAGNFTCKFGETDFYANYRRVEGTDGWLMISTAPQADYLEEYYRAIRQQPIATAILVVLGGLFAALIGIQMSNPIKHASQRALALARGDLSSQAQGKAYKRKDEIGVLLRSLETAVSHLRANIGDVTEKLGEMVSGNLDIDLSSEYEGDLVPIRTSLLAMTQSMNQMMQGMRQAAAQVSSGSDQVALASANLATGASEQAATIQEFSQTISHIGDMAQENAKVAQAALEENEKSSALMQQCTTAMNEMVEAMHEINRSSEEISSVIKVIDDIAFQTNILALNAAVEAARAGQHGKGFAVVADEVRNLAAKSAEAAKETSTLIEKSVQRANEGNDIVARVDEILHSIAQVSKRNSEDIKKINEHSHGQNQEMERVILGIEQISSVIQSNSATAEQTSAAAEEMSVQADVLNEMVSSFKLKEDESAASRVGAPV